MKIDGLIDGLETTIVVDTGAEYNLISSKLVSDLSNLNKNDREIKLLGIGGASLNCLGSKNIKVKLHDWESSVNMLVVEELPIEVIFGTKFLLQHSANIDFSEKYVTLTNSNKEKVKVICKMQRSHMLQNQHNRVHTCKPDVSVNDITTDECRVLGDIQVQDNSTADAIKVTIKSDVNLINEINICEIEHLEIGKAGNYEFIANRDFLNKKNLEVVGDLIIDDDKLLIEIRKVGRLGVKLFKGTTVGYLREKEELNSVLLVNDSIVYDELSDRDKFQEVMNIEVDVIAEQIPERKYDISPSLDSKQNGQLMTVLKKYDNVFAWDPKNLGCTDLVEHEIHTGDALPIYKKPYRVSHAEREIIQKQVEEMLENGIIRHSSSEWSSPVILVKKHDQSYRFICDYRGLNSVTIKNVYPMGLMEDVLGYLTGANYFITLDLNSGYWQCKVAEKDKHKTAFTCPQGLFEFNRLPFGLCNAPRTFSLLMDKLFSDMKFKDVLCYLDDLCIFAKTFEELLSKLERVLQRLRDANLTLKPSKCKFGYEELPLLGHVINRNGVMPDPKKVKAIQDYPQPTNVKDVQSYIGLANFYRRFVPNFNKVIRPLLNLIHKNVPFHWGDLESQAFEESKQKLISAPVLAHYNPEANLLLRVDASGIGVGGVLLQEQDNNYHPIGYVSRGLTKAEKNYSISERECLAVIYSIQQFRSFLWGKNFTIESDHSALCWLRSIKDPAGRLARWSVKLQDYDYNIVHKKGSTLNDADALSRYPCQEGLKAEEEEAIEIPTYLISEVKMHELQDKDPNIVEIRKAIEDPNFGNSLLQRRAKNFKIVNNILYKKSAVTHEEDKIVVPEELKFEILYSSHSEPLAGHLGFAKTFDKIKSRYFWFGMQKDVEKYVRRCPDCQTRKGPINQKPQGLLQPISVQNKFEIVGIDILGPIKSTKNGNRNIICATDYLTRWVETRAIPDAKAPTVAKFILEQIICRHGAPTKFLSDRGRVFQSEIVTELIKIMGSSSSFTTAFHPQTDGLVERFNGTVINMLSLYTSSAQDDWDEYLSHVTFAYNTSRQETTKLSPFELLYNRKAMLPTEIELTGGFKTNTVSDIAHRWLEAQEIARKNTENRQKKDKIRYDAKHREVNYNVGDKVKLRMFIRQVGKSDKLQPKYYGPYVVKRKLSPVNYEIQRGEGARAKSEIVHVSRLAPYYL